MRLAVRVAVAFVLSTPSFALAEDPRFEHGKREEVKGVEWKASAQAGLIVTTGNSETTTISGGATASRKAGCDKLSLEASAAYARSTILIAEDRDLSGDLDAGEITEAELESAKAWSIKGRYDRFFTERNSLFVSARLAADAPAGKELVGGGQVGYSRLLYKDPVHELQAEVGYDFTYEDHLAEGDPVSIHSARLFAGYGVTVSGATGIAASVEALLNLNAEKTPAGDVDALEDSRITAKAALTTRLSTKVSFRFGFTLRFDNAPAARAPFPIPYAPGFLPLAETTDTTTEVAVIVNIL